MSDWRLRRCYGFGAGKLPVFADRSARTADAGIRGPLADLALAFALRPHPRAFVRPVELTLLVALAAAGMQMLLTQVAPPKPLFANTEIVWAAEPTPPPPVVHERTKTTRRLAAPTPVPAPAPQQARPKAALALSVEIDPAPALASAASPATSWQPLRVRDNNSARPERRWLQVDAAPPMPAAPAAVSAGPALETSNGLDVLPDAVHSVTPRKSPARFAALLEPVAPQRPRVAPSRSASALRGVPLSALNACTDPSEEDHLKERILAVVRDRPACQSRAGTYHFVQSRNLNAFLISIEHHPDRSPRNRCDELDLALACLKQEQEEEHIQ